METKENHKKIGPLKDRYAFHEVLEMVKMDKKVEEMNESWGPDEKEVDKLMEWKDLKKQEFPNHPWRVKNLIPKEGSAIISSISGERKTWLALEMAKCISTGLPFLEDEMFKTEGCTVLYVDCENSLSELKRRCNQLGFPEESTHRLYLFNGSDMNFNSDEGSAWLHAMIQYVGAQVVFVDTFRSVAGGLKEEKAEEIRTFFGRFRKLKDEGVTIIWLDHFRKPSNFEKKIPQKEHLLGSQDKTAGVEVLLMLRSEPGSNEIDVYQRKNRLSKEVEPFKIKMDDWLDENNEIKTFLRYEGVIDEKETQKEDAKKYILSLLSSVPGLVTKEVIEAVQDEKKIGERNIRDALKELCDSNKIDFGKNGKQNYYFLPKELEEPLESSDFP